MKTKSFLIFLCAVSLGLFSCASTPEKKIDSVYVMVYDHENNEVMNVSVFADGEFKGQTDIYGRLSFYCGKEKEISFKAEKEGYETIEMKTAVRPGQLIYVKTGTAFYYAKQAESLLDKNEASKALEMINKSLEIEERKDSRYLKEVILKRQKNEK